MIYIIVDIPLHQKLKRLFLFFFLLLKVLFVGSRRIFSHVFSFSGSEFFTCTKVGTLSTKALKTCKAISKIASGSLTKKKKNICFGLTKTGTLFFVLEEKSKCCWVLICSKNTFVCLFSKTKRETIAIYTKAKNCEQGLFLTERKKHPHNSNAERIF